MIANPEWIEARYECYGSLLASSEQQVRDFLKGFDVTITDVGEDRECDGCVVRWYGYKAVKNSLP